MPMTEAASLRALITLADLVAYLGQDINNHTDTQKDALQRIINSVSQDMENECRVPLIKAAATEYYDGGRAKIILRRVPVDLSATFTVTEDGTELIPAADGSSKTAGGLDPDFWIDPETGIMERDGEWDSGRRIVEATYTAGVAVQLTTGGATRTQTDQDLVSVAGPDDLLEACRIICKAHTDLGPTNWGAQVVGDQVVRPSAWPLKARLTLAHYTYRR